AGRCSAVPRPVRGATGPKLPARGARPAEVAPDPLARPEAPTPSDSTAPPDSAAGLLDRLGDEPRAAGAPAKAPLMIIAGPGTGKTRTLTHRIVHQAVTEERPAEQFLAITFTRRAAQEMPNP